MVKKGLLPETSLDKKLITAWRSRAMDAGAYITAHYEGCDFHYKQTVTGVAKSHDSVPPAKVNEWKRLTGLLKTEPDEGKFDEHVAAIRRKFPMTKAWLKWWTRPRVAAMIFKCKKTMSAENSKGTTNNHAESNNRDQKRFLELNLDFAPAAVQKYMYVHNEEETEGATCHKLGSHLVTPPIRSNLLESEAEKVSFRHWSGVLAHIIQEFASDDRAHIWEFASHDGATKMERYGIYKDFYRSNSVTDYSNYGIFISRLRIESY
jgi:hypothetical protein